MKATPVKIDQVVKVFISSIGSKGDGVGKIEGMAIIVPGSEVNKTYAVKIVNVKEKFAFGEVLMEVEQ